ncbi:MAG: hypothetical protein IT583_05555 [Verrucomicrobia bacterium]|nr:hypothetical protein [Verrucomicrobiota bacterium]
MNIKITSVFSILMLCGGCAIQYKDISNLPEYRPLIGAAYTTTNTMYISGVNAPPGYEKTIDYYKIDPLNHNWSGPEKITEDKLPAGTKLTVKSVRKPTTYFLGDRIQSEVSITPYKTDEMHSVYIDLGDLKSSGNMTIENKPVQPIK